MRSTIYEYTQEAWDKYTFTSAGLRGEIKKVVTLQEIAPSYYNVLLQDEINGVLSSDITVTDNGDALKVINTVAAIIKDTIDTNPGQYMLVAGSDERRNRIYQRQITREMPKGEYVIEGARSKTSGFEPLQPEVQYIGFLIFRA